jgi:protein-disulfide isomerase
LRSNASEQGKSWEFHDFLFADDAKLDDPELIARARTLVLREEPFRACLASGKFKASVDADRKAGIKAGVGGTPGSFINGVFLNGAQSQAECGRVTDTQLSLLGHRSMP